RQYKDSTNKGTFVVVTHNSYERELLVGDRVRVSTQILAMDAKRLHLAHEMFMIISGQPASISVAGATVSSRSAVAFTSGKISTLRSCLSIARRRTPAASTTCCASSS